MESRRCSAGPRGQVRDGSEYNRSDGCRSAAPRTGLSRPTANGPATTHLRGWFKLASQIQTTIGQALDDLEVLAKGVEAAERSKHVLLRSVWRRQPSEVHERFAAVRRTRVPGAPNRDLLVRAHLRYRDDGRLAVQRDTAIRRWDASHRATAKR